MTVAELPACLRGRQTVWRALDSSEDREELVRSTCREGGDKGYFDANFDDLMIFKMNKQPPALGTSSSCRKPCPGTEAAAWNRIVT